MLGFGISVGHCNDCNVDFLYVPEKIHSVTNRNSDVRGIPRCPKCNRYEHTRHIGAFKVHVYSVRKAS